MHAWNSRALPARYYKGVAGITLRRSKHAWAIKGLLFRRTCDYALHIIYHPTPVESIKLSSLEQYDPP